MGKHRLVFLALVCLSGIAQPAMACLTSRTTASLDALLRPTSVLLPLMIVLSLLGGGYTGLSQKKSDGIKPACF